MRERDRARLAKLKEAFRSLAAFGHWAETQGIPQGRLDFEWELFLDDLRPLLAEIEAASTHEELAALILDLRDLVEEHGLRHRFENWLPQTFPKLDLVVQTVFPPQLLGGGTRDLEFPSASPSDRGQMELGDIEEMAHHFLWVDEEASEPTSESSKGIAGGDVATTPPEPRYANAVLVDQTADDQLLSQQTPIRPGQLLRLRLDIGALSEESAVTGAVPIDEHLPKEDIWLEVMVSSTHFEVSRTEARLGQSVVAHGRFFLPAGGAPARTPDDEQYLYFFMRAPQEMGQARARVGYYYRNHLIQSQLLVADVHRSEGGYEFTVDYALSHSLVGLEELPKRRQVSLLTNSNGHGTHQIVVRSGDEDGALVGDPTSYELDENTISTIIDRLRDVLRTRVVTAGEKPRSKRDLIEDLYELAPLGRQLWHQTVSQCFFAFYDAIDTGDNVVIQVTRPTTSSFVFPWGLIYNIPLTLDADMKVDETEKEATICPVIDRLEEAIVEVREKGLSNCPEAPSGGHDEQTLCPFGFWGYRWPIEQLSSSQIADRERRKDLARTIPALGRRSFEMVAAQTQDLSRSTLQQLERHMQDLRDMLGEREGQLVEGKDLAGIRSMLGQEDLPIVYFYCHGDRMTPSGASPISPKPNTVLGVGKSQRLSPQDFQNWVQQWFFRNRRIIWNQVRPLIFVNACHSVEVNPNTLVSYIDAFMGTAHAAGVIGTEVKVQPWAAMDIATGFFRRFLQGHTVFEALYDVRLDYLAHGNLYGLVYTPYCWADLQLV